MALQAEKSMKSQHLAEREPFLGSLMVHSLHSHAGRREKFFLGPPSFGQGWERTQLSLISHTASVTMLQ